MIDYSLRPRKPLHHESTFATVASRVFNTLCMPIRRVLRLTKRSGYVANGNRPSGHPPFSRGYEWNRPCLAEKQAARLLASPVTDKAQRPWCPGQDPRLLFPAPFLCGYEWDLPCPAEKRVEHLVACSAADLGAVAIVRTAGFQAVVTPAIFVRPRVELALPMRETDWARGTVSTMTLALPSTEMGAVCAGVSSC